MFGSGWMKRPITSTGFFSTRRTRGSDRLAEVVFDRRGGVRQRAEHQAAERGGAQLARADGAHVEILRHAALAVHAVAERDRHQVAAQVVAPGVIDAGEILGRAAVVQADQRAAMRAAVLERVHRAVLAAHDDHRHLAHEGGAEVAGVGDVHFQAQEIPHRLPGKCALALAARRPAPGRPRRVRGSGRAARHGCRRRARLHAGAVHRDLRRLVGTMLGRTTQDCTLGAPRHAHPGKHAAGTRQGRTRWTHAGGARGGRTPGA